MTLHPYRFFSNNCRAAMTRYQEIFGGRLDLMTMADMPVDDPNMAGVDPTLVMHAALVFEDGDMLMASDDPTGDGAPASGMSLHYTAGSIDDANRIFGQLADGGVITMPLAEVFWAERFGTCIDRFGTSWMISVDRPQPVA